MLRGHLPACEPRQLAQTLWALGTLRAGPLLDPGLWDAYVEGGTESALARGAVACRQRGRGMVIVALQHLQC